MIKDFVYLVTGGSSGLGRGTVDLLLAEGAYVTVLDLRVPDEDSTLKKYEDRLLLLQVDVTSEKDVANALDATKRKFGKLNGVINCAGIVIKTPVYDFTTNQPHSLLEFSKVINVNLIGTFNVIRLAVPLLAENEPNADGERGIIINTSSIAGHSGVPGLCAYSVSKAGIIALSRPLAKELSNYGIRVVDIAPGVMDTPMTASTDASNYILFPNRKGKPSEFAQLVKAITENPLLNATSIRLDAGGTF